MTRDVNNSIEYELTRLIDVGFTSDVWECTLTSAAASLTKVIRISHDAFGHPRCEFLTQVCRSLVRLNDASVIIPIRALGEWGDRLFLVTDYCGQSALRQLNTVASDDQLRSVMHLVAASLDSLRSEGICHGSVSPHHILFDGKRVKLTGLSRIQPIGRPNVRVRTRDLLTELCMARDETVTEHTDQFSLACTYIILRTRRIPRIVSSWQELSLKMLGSHEQDVLVRALDPHPGNRFECCGAFVEELLSKLVRKGDKSN